MVTDQEPDKLYTRYLLGNGLTYMNVLLDQRLPLATLVVMRGEMRDSGMWIINQRYETLEARSVERSWERNR